VAEGREKGHALERGKREGKCIDRVVISVQTKPTASFLGLLVGIA
jgi:hypothetical protein